jgi:hypothetical protein
MFDLKLKKQSCVNVPTGHAPPIVADGVAAEWLEEWWWPLNLFRRESLQNQNMFVVTCYVVGLNSLLHVL